MKPHLYARMDRAIQSMGICPLFPGIDTRVHEVTNSELCMLSTLVEFRSIRRH